MHITKSQTDTIQSLLSEAGNKMLSIYNRADFNVELKSDNSPVTEADKTVSAFLSHELKQLFPDYLMIDEETPAQSFEERSEAEYLWCLDPLDGTKEFIKRNGEFCICLALLYKNKAVSGFIYSPVLDQLYVAHEGRGTTLVENNYQKSIYITPTDLSEVKIMTSRSHTCKEEMTVYNALEQQGYKATLLPQGSALKFGALAEGKGNMYLKLSSTTCEWDTAAGQIILEEAGGKVVQLSNGKPMRYNKSDLLNPPFIASTSDKLIEEVLELIR